jgi:hypothetical protein
LAINERRSSRQKAKSQIVSCHNGTTLPRERENEQWLVYRCGKRLSRRKTASATEYLKHLNLDKISSWTYIFKAAFSDDGAAYLSPDGGMDIIQILWVINFFLFLLTLIFIWSKFYSISLRIKDILSIIKKCDDLPREQIK